MLERPLHPLSLEILEETGRKLAFFTMYLHGHHHLESHLLSVLWALGFHLNLFLDLIGLLLRVTLHLNCSMNFYHTPK